MKVALDGVVLGGLFEMDPYLDEAGVEWVLTTLNGWWGSPGTRTRRTDRVTAPGAFRAAAYKGVRTIELGGVFTAPTHSGLLTRRAARQLAAICSDPADLYQFIVQDEVSTTCCYVELDGDVLTELRDNLAFSMRFSVQLAASDPRKFNLDWTSSTAPAISAGSSGIDAGGAGIDTSTAGISAGTSATPSAAETFGAGTADNPQVLQVNGPTGNFVVTNTSGSSSFSFRGQLGPTESLYLNLDGQPAYGVPGSEKPIPGHGALIGRTNARAAIAVRGGWPVLRPGGAATYLIAGSLGLNSALIVHSRGAWS